MSTNPQHTWNENNIVDDVEFQEQDVPQLLHPVEVELFEQELLQPVGVGSSISGSQLVKLKPVVIIAMKGIALTAKSFKNSRLSIFSFSFFIGPNCLF